MVLANIKRLNQKIEDVTVNVNVSPNRIVSLDIIRGLFLISILIDHIELYPNGFDYFTGRGRWFVSAAEGFFFMSGLLIGMVYRRRLHLGMKFIFRKMWRRALVLYLASVFFSIFFTAAAVFTNHQTIKYGLYDVINWPHIIKETILMRYGYGWADFLDRFAILMFIAPFAFYLLTKGKWWLMAAISFLFWLWGQFGPKENNFTITWQFLFNGAMLIGFYWPTLSAKWHGLADSTRKKIQYAIIGVTAVTFIFSYAVVYLLSILNEKLPSLPHWLYSLTLGWNTLNADLWVYAQKWTLGPLRLVLFIFWFAALFMLINRYGDAINRRTKYIVELLGRNSLLVYIEHAFIVFAFKYYIPPQTVFWQNFLFTGGALLALIIVTVIYKNLEENINNFTSNFIAGLKRPFLRMSLFSSGS